MNVFEKLTQQWLGLENEELADVVDLADPRPTRTIVRDNFETFLDTNENREQTIATLLDQLVYAEEDEKDEIMTLLKILGYPGKEASVKTAQLQLLNEPPQNVTYSVGIIWFYDGREYYWDYRDPDAMHGHAFATLNGDEMPEGAYNADVYRGEKVDEDEIIYGNYWTGPLEVDLNAPGIALEDWVVQKAFDKFPDALNMRYFDGFRTEKIFLRMYPHEYDSFLNNNGYRPEVPIHFQQKSEKEMTDPSSTLGNPTDYQSVLDANKGENLEGLPGEVNVPNLGKLTFHSNADIQAIEENYREAMSWTDIGEKPKDYVKVDPDISAEIAQAYEEMEHDPNNPDVQTIYSHFKEETMWQYEDIVEAGYVFEFYPEDYDPYPNSPREAVLDLHNNKHMYVFPTETGFGVEGEEYPDHPILEETYVTWNGKPTTYNDIFRAVHDFFGHAKEGVGFRADGEDNAYRQHASMYSSLARKALFNETRGQNAWVNYGPHGEHNRTATAENTVFAPQKAGIPPEWAVDPDIHKSGWYREAGSADTQNFFSDAMSAQHSPNQPLQPDHVSQDPYHQEIYQNMQQYYGPFDEHIETSIPDFRSNSLRKVNALLQMGGGTFLDIAGGTGSLAKSLTDMSGGAWQTVNLEPNGEMINHFNQTPLENSQIIPEAFGESFEMDGQMIPQHVPSQQYDVVHESMGFQFIDSNREPQVAEAKNLLKPDGLFLTEEKFHTENEWENEQIKDEWKSNYYNTQQLERKNQEVGFQGQGPMTDNLWQDSEYEMLLRSYFAYVEEYWQSGNFKGYACSDDPQKVANFISGIGSMEVIAGVIDTVETISDYDHSVVSTEIYDGQPEEGSKFILINGNCLWWYSVGNRPVENVSHNKVAEVLGIPLDDDDQPVDPNTLWGYYNVSGYTEYYVNGKVEFNKLCVMGEEEEPIPSNIEYLRLFFPTETRFLWNYTDSFPLHIIETKEGSLQNEFFPGALKFVIDFNGESYFWDGLEPHSRILDQIGVKGTGRNVEVDTAVAGYIDEYGERIYVYGDEAALPNVQNVTTLFPPGYDLLFNNEMIKTTEVIQDVDVSDLSPTLLPGVNKFVLDIPSGNGYFWPYQDYRYHHPFVIRGLGYDQEGEGLSPDYEAPVIMGYYNNGGEEKTVFPLHSIEAAVISSEPTEGEMELMLRHFPEAININWNGKYLKVAEAFEEVHSTPQDLDYKFVMDLRDGKGYFWSGTYEHSQILQSIGVGNEYSIGNNPQAGDEAIAGYFETSAWDGHMVVEAFGEDTAKDRAVEVIRTFFPQPDLEVKYENESLFGRPEDEPPDLVTAAKGRYSFIIESDGTSHISYQMSPHESVIESETNEPENTLVKGWVDNQNMYIYPCDFTENGPEPRRMTDWQILTAIDLADFNDAGGFYHYKKPIVNVEWVTLEFPDYSFEGSFEEFIENFVPSQESFDKFSTNLNFYNNQEYREFVRENFEWREASNEDILGLLSSEIENPDVFHKFIGDKNNCYFWIPKNAEYLDDVAEYPAHRNVIRSLRLTGKPLDEKTFFAGVYYPDAGLDVLTGQLPDYLKTSATVNEEGYIGFEGEDIGNKHKFILSPDGEFYAWGKKQFDYGKGFLSIENEGTLYDELDDFTKYEWNMDASDTYQFYRNNGYATGQTSSGAFFMINAPSGLNVAQVEALENLFREQGYRNIIIHEGGQKQHFNNGKDALDYLAPRRNEEPEEKNYSGFFEGTPEYQAKWKQAAGPPPDMGLWGPNPWRRPDYQPEEIKQVESFEWGKFYKYIIINGEDYIWGGTDPEHHEDILAMHFEVEDSMDIPDEILNSSRVILGSMNDPDHFGFKEINEEGFLLEGSSAPLGEPTPEDLNKLAEMFPQVSEVYWIGGDLPSYPLGMNKQAEMELPFGYANQIHSPDTIHKFLVDEYTPIFWTAPMGSPSYPTHAIAADEIGLTSKFDIQAFGYYWPLNSKDNAHYPSHLGVDGPIIDIISSDGYDQQLVDALKEITGVPYVTFNNKLVDGNIKQSNLAIENGDDGPRIEEDGTIRFINNEMQMDARFIVDPQGNIYCWDSANRHHLGLLAILYNGETVEDLSFEEQQILYGHTSRTDLLVEHINQGWLFGEHVDNPWNGKTHLEFTFDINYHLDFVLQTIQEFPECNEYGLLGDDVNEFFDSKQEAIDWIQKYMRILQNV